MDIFDVFSEVYAREKQEDLSLQDYLLACRDDPIMYASAAERMIAAIGEPELVDTSKDPRLGRIFMNRTIKRYPAFTEFYGMEETIERIVGFFRHAAQGLEERKQILYLLGPVGGGKSSLAERLKQLMENEPIYVLKAGDEISPVFECPLGLFDPERMGDMLEDKYGIPRRRLTGLMSPWAVKRLDEFGGDISQVLASSSCIPSKLRQIGVAKTEPGDENNQDISSLVGKVDIRKLEHFSQNDPDAYSYSGGLNRDDPGPARIRRDVQGADQDAASAADRDAGRQLCRHREHRRHPLSGHHHGALERGGMAAVQEQQEQRGLPRPHLRDQGALLPARHRGERRSTRSCCARANWRTRPARRTRWKCWPLLGALAPEASTRIRTCSPRCASMTARA